MIQFYDKIIKLKIKDIAIKLNAEKRNGLVIEKEYFL
jgi:hypothetical protein